MPNRSSKQKLVVRDNSKFLGCRGRVYKQGGPKFFMAIKKQGPELWGLYFFSLKKGGGHYLYFFIKNGKGNFFTSQVLKRITFTDNSEPGQPMFLPKSKN